MPEYQSIQQCIQMCNQTAQQLFEMANQAHEAYVRDKLFEARTIWLSARTSVTSLFSGRKSSSRYSRG